MARTSQISKEKRQSIIILRHERQSIQNISKTFKVSSTAVAKTIKRYDETGSHEDRHRTGIPGRLPLQQKIQWGKKVFSQPPIVQVLPLKKMREACNFHHRYTSTMTDKMRKKNPENHF